MRLLQIETTMSTMYSLMASRIVTCCRVRMLLQGYLAHEESPPPYEHHRAFGMVLL